MIGGSFAGLLVARVLADHVGRVVVLERDDRDHGPLPRPSVPQGRHGHFLQPAGLDLLEGWFPGLTASAVALGAELASPGRHQLYADGVPVDFPDVTMLIASRPFLEHQIYRRVRALPNVEFRRARAGGLRFRGDAVDGVALRPVEDGGGEHPEQVLAADVVVDATGRNSPLFRWLGQAGFPVPAVLRHPVNIGYTTALFARRHTAGGPGVVCALDQFVTSEPSRVGGDRPAGAAVYAVEGNLWQLVVMAYGRDRRQVTIDELRALAAALPEVFREAARGRPVGEIARYFYRAGVYRPVVDAASFPTGLLAVGDSVASFDPIRGQGMYSVARQASIIAEFMAGGGNLATGSRDCIQARDAVVGELWAETEGALDLG
ncbi:NAD(P)/FAD-dependent oxidoreductase [Actinoplanes sp. RD1]|uniref:NAD(P)/FAD-dependent oxidoreductase n=1 Tax=Actinoplanes sp. RD1 TaxID=3064538 RepID=UPI002741DEA0|nr:hypothetical protein [Actinoplanes sp. RD1]